MPDTDTPTETDTPQPAIVEAIRSTESYEVSEGVVFYNAENPLAWMQADHVVDLEEAA
ncbi:MAG: hypothetical protein V5A36_05215 [Natronomonas sp.]